MAWPILLGLALGLFARLRPVGGTKIPPGDLVRAGGWALDSLHEGTQRLGGAVGTLVEYVSEKAQRDLQGIEERQPS